MKIKVSRGFFTFSLILMVIFIFACSKETVYQSSNWKVTINSSEYQKDYKYQSYPAPNYIAVTKTREGFVIQLTISYIGFGDSAPAPKVYLKRMGDHKLIEYNYSKLENVIIDENKEDLKSQSKIGKDPNTGKFFIARADYVFPVPDDKTEYLLIIGDLKPITVRP